MMACVLNRSSSIRLPDSAIELLDEACSNTKIDANTDWEKLGKWRRREVMIKMQLQSLEVRYCGYITQFVNSSSFFPTA